MKALLATFWSVAGVSSLIGALLLAAIAWIFVPALVGSDSPIVPWAAAAVPMVLWSIGIVLLALSRRRRDAALVAGAVSSDQKDRPEEREAHVSEEEAAMSRQLAEALGALRTAAGGRGGYLYERPWYVIIGPPGAGKTTAIQNSGLEFPLKAGRVKGVGGTRNCDWWISEQAVLIDTAGRYTTQDSDGVADKAGWERFLQLLRRERPRQPLNGVIVAFGADMLSRLDQTAREENARAVRRRIRDLEQHLDQRLPVYFLVSKADLVVGFTEFFDDLNKDTRGQVWGMTFPADVTPAGQVARFHEDFTALVGRLQDRLLERLQAERGPEQRARIGGFPAQFASLEPSLGAFVATAFGGSQLDPAPFLRGIYFTSGTQEGTPIDRLTGALSRAFGLDPRRPAALMGQAGRSYFLGRLLREVVFNEARLAARDRFADRRRWLVQAAAWSAAILAVLVGGAWGVAAMRAEDARSERLAAAIRAAGDAAGTLTFDPVRSGDDLQAALPYLDRVRDLQPAAAGGGAGLGLAQSDKLAAAARGAYRHVLERVLLPRLLVRLETQMRGAMQRPDFLYEATRVYLMLARQGPLDRPLVKEWMRLDWEQAFPGTVGSATRDGLSAHLGSLLDSDFATYPVDQALVDEARIVFSKLPLPERIYARLRTVATAAPAWRPAEVLGPAGQRWFTRPSGKPLQDLSVPGLFTVEGLNGAFLPHLPGAIAEAASESWVLGQQQSGAPLSDPRQLETAILHLYAEDYAKAWQAALGDIALVPFRSLQQASDGLNVLGAPNSPIRDLLQGAARQLSPSAPPAGAQGALEKAAQGVIAAATPGSQGAGAAPAPGEVTTQPSQGLSRLASAVGAAVGPPPAAVVGQVVEERFRALREAAGPSLDGTLALLRDLYAAVAPLANTAPGSAAPQPVAGPDPGQRLASEAQRAPEPLSRWLAAVAQSTTSLRAGGAKAAIAAAAAAKLTPFCRQAETRFPFSRNPGAPDMPIDDFTRLFGPSGGFDQFFDQMLARYVDVTQKPWRPTSVGGAPAPVSAADVAQFQRARTIRDAFFPGGASGGQGLRFDLIPLGVDAGARGAVLEAEGNKTPIAPGPGLARPVELHWPARNPVSLTFDPSTAAPLETEGPWAALKFVARGRLAPSRSPDRLRLTIQQGERSAEFELRTGSIVNPFGLRELAEFRCPQFQP